MKRLPNLNDVITQVKKHAEDCRNTETQKLAAAIPTKTFTCSIASDMYKLAQQLKTIKLSDVTVEDVKNFTEQLLEKK